MATILKYREDLEMSFCHPGSHHAQGNSLLFCSSWCERKKTIWNTICKLCKTPHQLLRCVSDRNRLPLGKEFDILLGAWGWGIGLWLLWVYSYYLKHQCIKDYERDLVFRSNRLKKTPGSTSSALNIYILVLKFCSSPCLPWKFQINFLFYTNLHSTSLTESIRRQTNGFSIAF